MTTNGTIDKEKELIANQLQKAVLNALETRTLYSRQIFNTMFDRRRDIYQECGYPEAGDITAERLHALYDREPVAATVVDYFPKRCWSVSPEVYEEESDDTTTPFEQSWSDLGKSLRGTGWAKQEDGKTIYDYLERLDKLSGIGCYGVLLLGLDDGLDLSLPVKGVEEAFSKPEGKEIKSTDSNGMKSEGNGVYNLTLNLAKTKDRKLLYLRAFPQKLAPIIQIETNPTSYRYNQPVMYSITFADRDQLRLNGSVEYGTTRNVHWTRVVHVPSDDITSSEVLSSPRMLGVLNPLLDIQKIRAADGEGYWQNAFAQIFLEMLPEFADMKADISTVRDTVEQMMHGLKRWGALEGFTAKSLPPSVSDPTPHIDVNLRMIAIKTGIPKRRLEGSEVGELASSQDAVKDEMNVQARRDGYCTSRILIPFLDRGIMCGFLQPPKEEYCVEFPLVDTQGPVEKAQIAKTKTDALVAYISGGGEQLITPENFLTRFLDFEPDEAEAMLEDAEEHMLEVEQDEIDKEHQLIDEGLKPDPTDPGPQPPIKMKDGDKLVSPQGKPIGK